MVSISMSENGCMVYINLEVFRIVPIWNITQVFAFFLQAWPEGDTFLKKWRIGKIFQGENTPRFFKKISKPNLNRGVMVWGCSVH